MMLNRSKLGIWLVSVLLVVAPVLEWEQHVQRRRQHLAQLRLR